MIIKRMKISTIYTDPLAHAIDIRLTTTKCVPSKKVYLTSWLIVSVSTRNHLMCINTYMHIILATEKRMSIHTDIGNY